MIHHMDPWSPENIAARLVRRIDDLDIGRQKLSEISGVSKDAIDKFCQGKNLATVARIVKIAKALKWTPNELLGLEHKSAPDQEILRLILERLIETFNGTQESAAPIAAVALRTYATLVELGVDASDQHSIDFAIQHAKIQLRELPQKQATD